MSYYHIVMPFFFRPHPQHVEVLRPGTHASCFNGGAPWCSATPSLTLGLQRGNLWIPCPQVADRPRWFALAPGKGFSPHWAIGQLPRCHACTHDPGGYPMGRPPCWQPNSPVPPLLQARKKKVSCCTHKGTHHSNVLIAYFCLSLNNIPLYRGTTVCSSIHLLKDILIASMFWQL